MAKAVEQLEQVTIRFAGDSGDGMQLTGGRFTSETAALGNDLSTLPDFPAEIRAPAGSLPGVSGFQIHFADHDILTPGDQPDVLVAMNPAALKTNLADLREGGTLIVNRDAFSDRNLQKAGYTTNPLEDGTLEQYKVHAVPLSTMTVEALKEVEGITPREAERSKNFFALGLMSWLYGRPTETTLDFIETKFAAPAGARRRRTRVAFKAGYNYGETSEDFIVSYEVRPAKLAPGVYRNITGNEALVARPRRRLDAAAGSTSSSAHTRSRRPPASSRSSRATSTSGSARSRPKTRSPLWARRSAPRSAVRSA